MEISLFEFTNTFVPHNRYFCQTNNKILCKIKDMSTYAERLKLAMDNAVPPVSQTELAKAIGIKPQSIQYLCDPARNAKGSTHTSKIAERLGVDALWLADGRWENRPPWLMNTILEAKYNDPKYVWDYDIADIDKLGFASDLMDHKERMDKIVDQNVSEARTTGKLPLISWVQAGAWSEIVDNFQPGDAEDWIPCPFNHGQNAFILRVSGHSMYNPGGDKSYAPGEYIAVDPSAEPLNKKMVVARVDHEDKATFKQLIIDPEGEMMLQALNPNFSPRIMTLPEGSSIVGVVIGKWVPE